ncbi:MAG: NAD(P)H-dependent oxidoreductase [Chloroflexaceae bacterium]|nr:NAD(P)H-dependent oxidoreductase [Chloroflexaceae bacterium]NJO04705.1 NAD(P)H-dependent oxidoreductase [Chloroflexaceae bacterium]
MNSQNSVHRAIKVLGISGSLRVGSYNTSLLRAAADLLPEGMTLELFDLAAIPLYNADTEAQGFPPTVRELRERIAAADALLIATPEYNYSIPGVLKNAIDWASRPPHPSPLDSKPTAIVGAGGRVGTARAQLHLRQILMHTNTLLLGRPELFVQRASEQFDAAGNLTNETTREALQAVLEGLAGWTRRLYPVA